MTYSEFFAEIKGKFLEADVSNIKDHLTFQFNIIGEAQGIFYIELKNGKIRIEAVRRKRIDPEKEGMVNLVGMVLLFGLMFIVMFNDIRKLF